MTTSVLGRIFAALWAYHTEWDMKRRLRIGHLVSFMNPQGKVRTGEVIERADNRVLIEEKGGTLNGLPIGDVLSILGGTGRCRR